MEIQRADASDLPGLSGLFDGYRQFYRQQPDRTGASSFIRERLAREDSVIFIALEDDLPVGFVQLYPSFSSVAMQRIFILNDLFVRSDARENGTATALLGRAEAFALEAGAARLALATETTNVAAQALYEKLGWQKEEDFIHFEKGV